MSGLALMDLDSLLAHMIEIGGSDLHLKVDSPPMARVDGTLTPVIGEPPLDDEVTRALPDRRQRADAAQARAVRRDRRPRHGLPSRRTTAASASTASASAARSPSRSAIIPKTVPSFEKLGLPLGVEKLADEHRGLVLVTGATGSGKSTTLAAMIDKINRTRKQHIVDDRGPDRDRPRGQGLHRQPARGRARHRLVPRGPPAGAPPGPRRDPDRRAPRRGVRARRAPGVRVRPPRPLDAAHDRRCRDRSAGSSSSFLPRSRDDAPDPRRRPARRRSASASCRARTAAGSPRSR